jgi:hypothetical protein
LKVARLSSSEYGVELSVEKSRVVWFSRFQLGKNSERFDFLGFEFRWVVDHKRMPRVTCRTQSCAGKAAGDVCRPAAGACDVAESRVATGGNPGAAFARMPGQLWPAVLGHSR